MPRSIAIARIGLDAELAAGRRGAQRIEIGGFEENIGRRIGDSWNARRR